MAHLVAQVLPVLSKVASLTGGNGADVRRGKCSVTLGADYTGHQKRFEILFIRLCVCNESASPSAGRDSTLRTVQGGSKVWPTL
jgi:hypothetical protein